ncbi:carboxypeptidase-like regulatory domain-containing protein [Flavobacterium terrigena]|uniref:CarboxypepD_reg-like domain-containing protein n=1 Tax=Flavobacterium terrigena TaxID=402734 RepID=A0A1H6XMD3_9FLAO|nr:carboxypeptidase-like regulatory domain-containing protein [Flavobacterium terrigena]SEJ30233.1 CarboxypepD_reg-like domain-containing protein [Flavobacterium terrigena]
MYKIFLLLLFPVFVFAQNIKGKITNSNNEPIAGASIYLDGTTIGTSSDSEGLFEISAKNKYNTLLIVRFLGYEDIIVSNPYEKEFYTFVLVPKTNEIETVLIVKDGFTRKQKLQLFREQFLGTTKYGKACKILNEDAIDFNYDLDTFLFTATSSEPIKIENPQLGYLIEFDLHDFYVKFSFKTIKSAYAIQSMFLGTVRYTDVSTDEKIIKNRNDVYFGSSMHFFKNIIDNSWSSKNFILYEGKFSVNANNYFKVVKSNDLYEVTVSPTIKPELNLGSIKNDGFYADFNLLFDKKRQSRVIFKTKTFFIDNFGNNTDKEQIIFGGDIGQQKVGNTLPLNFEPEMAVK